MERWQLISEVVAYLEDEGLRPHVLLQTKVPGTCGVPSRLIKEDGHVVLNLSSRATANSLRMGMYQCQANMTFNQQHYSVAWHPDAVEAVYSPDGGPKLVFPPPDPNVKPVDRRKPRPKLSLVGGTSVDNSPETNSEDYDDLPPAV